MAQEVKVQSAAKGLTVIFVTFFTNGGVLQHLHSTENDPMQYASSEMNTLGHASF